MPSTTLILSTLFSALSFSLVVFLLIMLAKSQSRTNSLLISLVREERRESQSLRNQLRSPDVGTLMGLQQATMEDRSSEPVVLDDDLPFDNPDEGYALGAINNDLEAAGWAQPVLRRDEDGSYIAVDRQ